MRKEYTLLFCFLVATTVRMGASSVWLSLPSLSVSLAITQTIDCAGNNNGEITATASGGTTPYNYSINGSLPSTNNIFSGLSAGSYTVTVQDGGGNTATASLVLTAPSTLNGSAVVTPVACFGTSTGVVTLNATGGTLPYTYSFGGLTQASNVISNLPIGSYNAAVTDNNGCVDFLNLVVTGSTQLNTFLIPTNILCAGETNAQVTVFTSGGVPPYTYSFDGGPGQLYNVFTGLGGGNFPIYVTDMLGCMDTALVAIWEPSPLVVNLNTIQPECGTDRGIIRTNVSGAVTPYTYLWSTGATTPNINGLVSGSYTVTVTDRNGCTQVASSNIVVPSIISLTLSHTDLSCANADDGTVIVSATGGTPPYSYLWSNGSTRDTLSGLSAGAFTVTVTDANDCPMLGNVTLQAPPPIILDITGNNISCGGNNTGSITVVASGGVPSYQYFLDGVADADGVFSNLIAGTYIVEVRDATDCSVTASYTVNEPVPIAISTTPTNITCNGLSDGMVSVEVTGGEYPYQYSLNGVALQSDSVFIGLDGGVYLVLVVDAVGCSQTAQVSVTEPAQLTLSTFNANISCNGGNDGSINVSVVGGLAPYLFGLNGSIPDNSNNFVNLTAGTYTIDVFDRNNCTTQLITTLTEPDTLLIDVQFTPISCSGVNSTVTLTAQGGVPPFSYFLDGDIQNNGIFTNVTEGYHTCQITDAKGCSSNSFFTITAPSPITLDYTATDVSCFGNADATITVTASGGTGLLSYQLDGGTLQTSTVFTGVSAGSHILAVTDIALCHATAQILINTPEALNISAQIQSDFNGSSISCAGAADGAAIATGMGGAFPYTYVWSNGNTGAAVSDLTSGTYNVTIYDTNGCSNSTSVTLTQPTPITASAFIVSDYNGFGVSCPGSTDGIARASAQGGTPPYTYNWGNTVFNDTITNLAANTSYVVQISDANGCSATASVLLSEPPPIVVATSGTDLMCFEGNDGIATVTATGGIPSYTFLWSNGSTTSTVQGLSAGTHAVTVTDRNGCTATANITLSQPAGMTILVSTELTTCINTFDGQATVQVSGGSGNYTYQWDSNENAQTAHLLGVGEHQITVTDGTGCSQVQTFTIFSPLPITLTTSSIPASCFGAANASATVIADGGTPPFSYQWNTTPVQTTPSINNIAGGATYQVTVTDYNGCSATTSVQVEQPGAPLTLTLTGTLPICASDSSGSATVASFGGTPPYQYLWSNGDTTATTTHVPNGIYAVTVTDAGTCIATGTYEIVNPDTLLITASTARVSCFGAADGAIYIQSTSGGTGVYTYSIDGVNYQSIPSFIRLTGGTYTVHVRDSRGCDNTLEVIVPEPQQFVVDAGADVSINYGDSITLTPTTNDTGSITFVWTPNTYIDCVNCINPTVTPPLTTQYIVYALTDDGCEAQDDILVNVLKDKRIFIPNAFTPNDDNVNDVFMVHANYQVKRIVRMQLFDRWGMKVYEGADFLPNDKNNGWDGNINSKPLNTQVLAYVVEVEYDDGEYEQFKGNVTLIR
jgi:gliding motility-associated-like protein